MPDRKRTPANEQDQERNHEEEHPQRPEPDTLEGPGGRPDAKRDEDAANEVTRRGER